MTDQDEDMAGDLAAWTRWQAESKPDVAALRAEIATLRQQLRALIDACADEGHEGTKPQTCSICRVLVTIPRE
jgi:phage host-nuclease inhibitor protein Gam